MENTCKRCLLREMADNDYYKSVVRYRDSLPTKQRTSDAEYEMRISLCQACKELTAGTCAQCGCYVEMRAAKQSMHCPLSQPRW